MTEIDALTILFHSAWVMVWYPLIFTPVILYTHISMTEKSLVHLLMKSFWSCSRISMTEKSFVHLLMKSLLNC